MTTFLLFTSLVLIVLKLSKKVSLSWWVITSPILLFVLYLLFWFFVGFFGG